MATFKGNDGVLKIGSNQIGEIISYSIEETTEVIDDTSMGDTSRTFFSSLKSFSGSCEVHFDDTNAGQLDIQNGEAGALSVQMEGDTSGDHKLSGNIIVTGRTITGTIEDTVKASITFQGSGALTEGTV